jgi:hypothetical protein
MEDDQIDVMELRQEVVTMAGNLPRINNFLHKQDIEWLQIHYHLESPWLEFSCWVHLRGEFRFAIWRNTGAIHQVLDGAVTDDPIRRFPTK